jgi:dTDP-glucose 4,6-dehydratase
MSEKKILVTGGCGFIGSHLLRYLVNKYPGYLIVNFDALTYAGNLDNVKDLEDKQNYAFEKGDICQPESLKTAFKRYHIDTVIHLAAESHVDRSIGNSYPFVKTNIEGTWNVLETARSYWEGTGGFDGKRFHHVSTDEVYGALGPDDLPFTEETRYDPHSPYSASKASSDHLVRAYGDTYGMPVTISNCSNNYGPNQHPEKLIPKTISRLLAGKKVPVYGTGKNVRDWLYVEDHCNAIDLILHNGKIGETYNIGGHCELSNLEVVKAIIDAMKAPSERDYSGYIDFVEDRKGHDFRYSIDSTKLERELGWESEHTFNEGMEKTVRWYLENREWVDNALKTEKS